MSKRTATGRQRDPGDRIAGPHARTRRRERWEGATKWPLIALSVAFVAAYSIVVLLPDLQLAFRGSLLAIMAVAWAAFIVDAVVRFILLTPPPDRGSYTRRHLADVISAVLPPVRPFQLLGYLKSTPGFRGHGGNAFRSRVIATAAAYAAVFVYVIALTALLVERPASGATIVSFGDAVWWACVTIATVGYGDYTPVTAVGRLLAVVLMAGGVVIIGTSSAIVVSYVTERVADARRALPSSDHADVTPAPPDASEPRHPHPPRE